MSENCVEIASLVRQIVLDTLKSSAPGVAEQMRIAIANSVAMKVRNVLVPTPGAVCDCLMCLAEGDNSPHRRRASPALS